jgi:hypothetical protein
MLRGLITYNGTNEASGVLQRCIASLRLSPVCRCSAVIEPCITPAVHAHTCSIYLYIKRQNRLRLRIPTYIGRLYPRNLCDTYM